MNTPTRTDHRQERMPVRDRDLRQVLVDHDGHPGTSLFTILKELQQPRDREKEEKAREE